MEKSKVFRIYIDIIAEDEQEAFACADQNAEEELRERGTLGDSDVFNCIEIEKEIKQCCSCEKVFTDLKDGNCPHCSSGNWVKGYIDEAEK